jgi:hypothetical protein
MSNFATMYGKLGRHADALDVRDMVVKFYYQVLQNMKHPVIGEGLL